MSVATETDRLLLRDWRESDKQAFYDIMNTPPVMKHLGGVQDWEGWSAAYDRIAGFTRDFGHTFWIVEDKATGEILGFCGLKRVNAPGSGDLLGTPEIGWRLRESAWGRGIAKEAAIASLDLAFGRFGYPEVIAMTIPANTDSQGLMIRLGMVRREDLDFTDTRFGPELNPAIVWSIDAKRWPAARAAALA
ncbi:GNAT family N-acetyltransferase [Sphingomonas jaspsi]|uniref:GNAT family N-acetyltransferase n=1 Tax=Sphingomonas jaspsi TaxID=392409 RepID=UPI000560BD38|nr:GNAT family N-acetyltransferase [Sphingomonas jaspsi]